MGEKVLRSDLYETSQSQTINSSLVVFPPTGISFTPQFPFVPRGPNVAIGLLT